MDPRERFRGEVDRLVSSLLDEMGVEARFDIETPDAEIADFAVPCFPLAKVLKRPPKEIAEDMSQRVGEMGLLSRVWGESGYLNFRMDEDQLVRCTLDEILRSKGSYGQGEDRGRTILLEHTSVNPTGPIHVGRARNPLIGDTLARSLRRTGYEVITEYYVNDVGKQVVLLTWGLENIDPSTLEGVDHGKEDHRLVAFYRRANEMMESDPAVGEEISDMLRRFEEGDEEVIHRVRHTARKVLDGIMQSLEEVRVDLDSFVWESQFILDGSARRVVDRLRESDFCHQEEGAYYLDLEEFGVHGRDTKFFFTRRDGTTLYTTRDMAYHLDKFSRADHLINVLGEDQKLGMQHLASALSILGGERAPENVFFSFVSLPEGRMSTRRGRTVNLDDLIDEAEERALEEVRKRREDLSEERMREIARSIG
ncbi:MAG: arginine--tRNA ligase, partial [Thermoplasmatota archaeon]